MITATSSSLARISSAAGSETFKYLIRWMKGAVKQVKVIWFVIDDQNFGLLLLLGMH